MPRATLGKLRPPRHGRAIPRARLFDALDALAAYPALWVSGPAGIGKTTLASTWLDARGTYCLWLRLDASDDDPAAFLQLLDDALVDASPAFAGMLARPTLDDLHDPVRLLRVGIGRLDAALSAPWVLVLDDVHALGVASRLHDALAAVLESLPDRMRIVFIGRDPPPPSFAHAIASQTLGLLHADALRFSLAETRALVALHGPSRRAKELHRMTDGWAAAMILILSGGEPGRSGSPDAEGLTRQRLFAYFASEVVQRMPLRDVEALTRIALLPDTNATMAVALSGNPGAGALLVALAERSLFTYRRDREEPIYSFHALFSAYLRERLEAELPARAVHALRLEAVRLLIAQSRIDDAIAALIALRAWRKLSGLLTEHAAAYVERGRTGSLRAWIAALPSTHRERPAMQYWLGVCELSADPAVALPELEAAWRGYTAVGDTHGAFRAAAAAADAIVTLGESFASLLPLMGTLEAHVESHLVQRDTAMELHVLPGLLAAFVHLRTDQPATARLVGAAEELLEQPHGAAQRILLGTVVLYLLWTGRLARLDRVLSRIDRLCEDRQTSPITLVRWYGTGVLVRSLLGRVDEARRDAATALALATGRPALLVRAHLMAALAAVTARHVASARDHLDAASATIGMRGVIDMTTLDFQRGLLHLLEGDHCAAVRVMRDAVDSGRRSAWPLREHIALLGHAIALTESGELDTAERVLGTALAHPFYVVCPWHRWLAAMIEANLADRRHDLPATLSALRRALTLHAAHGFDSGPLLHCCGDVMPRLCAIALEHGVGAHSVAGIVRRYSLPAPPVADERWPWPVRIRTLGQFSIERDDGALPISRKQSRMSLDLLKLLVAYGGTAVPNERLAALLWPDGDVADIGNSFDNTLHRLRKLLGDGHLTVRSGCLGLNAATCWSDAGALDACLRSPLPDDADTDAVVTYVDRVLALYRGPFLDGDERHARTVLTRERLRSLFLRRMDDAGSRLDAGGRFDDSVTLYRHVLEQDPLAENIHRRLIVCLLKLGRRAEAYEAYRRCRQQLSVVLGICPSAATEALVATLRER